MKFTHKPWIWAAVAGLMFNFFTIGLTLWSDRIGVESGDVAYKPMAYLLLAIVVWWVVAHAYRARGGILQAFYRIALPVAAALMLVCPIANATGFACRWSLAGWRLG